MLAVVPVVGWGYWWAVATPTGGARMATMVTADATAAAAATIGARKMPVMPSKRRRMMGWRSWEWLGVGLADQHPARRTRRSESDAHDVV